MSDAQGPFDIAEMVFHHTGDAHEWFRTAQSDPSSAGKRKPSLG